MNVQWNLVDLSVILPFRELYLKEVNCQIHHYAYCKRYKTSCYVATADGSSIGYAIVDRECEKDTLNEYYVLPEYRRDALPVFRQLLSISQATSIRAQTNDRLLSLMLYDCAEQITSPTLLFADAITTHHAIAGAMHRKTTDADKPRIFEHKMEPVGDQLIEVDGVIVATGGAFFHYNPPYGDIYMEVSESARRKGFGTLVVQAAKRACYEMGKIPGARCPVTNIGSRRTLEKAGFLLCGRILRGTLNISK